MKADNLYQAAVALVNPAGQVVFTGTVPFKSQRNVAVTLDEVKAAID